MRYSTDREFISKEVSFGEYGIQLLRNKFVYNTYGYRDIKEISICKGYLLKNRLLLIFGCIGIIMFGSNILKYGIEEILKGEMAMHGVLSQILNKGSMFSIWGPLILIISSLIGVYAAFIRSHIAKIAIYEKTYHLRIKEISDANQMEDLVLFLKSKKVVINKEST